MVSLAALPTRLQGSVSDGTYDAWLGEMLEQIPNLVWPLSIQTYAQMRRHHQLSAILAGYTLQIRRASWTVDPAGCRPEVAQLVADDLGLPVAGDDKPRAARVRGVSWAEHLRAALSCLTYGHAAFELLAEMRDGRARLTMLAERPAHTITALFADERTGAFQGITQDVPGKLEVPQVKAERMVFYSYEREGNSWQGVSLLRPAYGSWLLAQEARRVLATSSRRFGMGVPVMKALPGTIPTDAQMTAALNLATQSRVGDQGGAVVPPNFSFELVGMTGSAPDTLGFVRYLDQSMSRSALMSHLDLGTTDSGSRALAEAFVEVLMMAIGAVADLVADTITRQAAARIVEWNWGGSEPVPAVRVSGIGSRREVTAESLNLLLGSGALSADPGLEAHIRREWRLPERQAAPVPVPTPVAASRKPRKPRAGKSAPAQLALPIAAAAPTDPDLSQLQADHQQAIADTAAVVEAESGPVVEGLVAAAVAALAAGSIADLGTLVAPAAAVTALGVALAVPLVALAETSADRAVAETGQDPLELPADSATRVEQTAQATAALLVQGMASGASREALRHTGADVDVDAVASAVRSHLTDLAAAKESGWVADNLASAATTAQAEGRRAAQQNAPAGIRWRATEELDGSTCVICRDADGNEFDTVGAAYAIYPAGKHVGCLGRDRCRGQIVPLLPVLD